MLPLPSGGFTLRLMGRVKSNPVPLSLRVSRPAKLPTGRVEATLWLMLTTTSTTVEGAKVPPLVERLIQPWSTAAVQSMGAVPVLARV